FFTKPDHQTSDVCGLSSTGATAGAWREPLVSPRPPPCSAPVQISRRAAALYPGAMTTPSLRTRIQHRLIRALGGEVTPSGQPGTTALVTAAGGARSSDEPRALQYLYEQEGRSAEHTS